MIKKLPLLLLFVLSFLGYSQSQSYYNGLDLTKTGDALFLELSSKLKATHNAIPYSGGAPNTWTVLMDADEDPDNNNNVLLIYGYDNFDGEARTDYSRDKSERDTGGGDIGKWNREHVFPKSLASPSLTTGDQGPGTDVHNLRPADAQQNSKRSNRKFTDGSGLPGIVESNGGWYPGDEWKGDVARVILYMYLRYDGDGSNVANQRTVPVDVGFGDVNTSDPNMVDLFLKWNAEDPVSDFEEQRNPIIEGIQGNRNPFIDNPYLATLIWGGIVAEDLWNMGNSDDDVAPSKVTNIQAVTILDEEISLSWDASTDNKAVFDYLIYVDGDYVKSSNTTTVTLSNLDQSTTYEITIIARDTSSNLSEASDVLEVTTKSGPNYLIRENFDDCASISFVAVSEASDKNWGCQSTFGENNSGSMGMNGYQENESSLDWLITKEQIDFDIYTGELLSFYADAAFGGSPLTLEFSSDYNGDGNPSNYTWSKMPNVSIPVHSNGSSTEEVFKFEKIDIGEITGTVYIAFKYDTSGEDPTRWTLDNFEIIADNASGDSDGDGVENSDDLCPNTAVGADVDENGCAWEQLDDDNDGVENGDDLCENTPEDETADETGCAPSQLDDDMDGVMNDKDVCPNTVLDATVDENGCAWEQLDDDNDGVENGEDQCENSPAEEDVNSNGCAPSQLDDDNDGVTNDKDQCNNTPEGADVNADGCAASQLDDDNDGVTNDLDLCLETIANAPVNSAGCFSLPASNFTIQTVGETCPGKSNGTIEIVAAQSFDYVVSFGGENYEFSSKLTLEDVLPGAHEFCITVKNTDFEQCFGLEIEQGVSLLAKSSSKNKIMTVEIASGTAPFNVSINDELQFQTYENTIRVPVENNDKVVITTSKSCEGTFEKQFIGELLAYPNPAKERVSIVVGTNLKEVSATLMTVDGGLISTQILPVIHGKIQMDVKHLRTGMYLMKLNLEQPTVVKILKE